MANAKFIEGGKMKILMYGPSGVGKTTLASTFPGPHFVDFDNGMLSVAGQDIEYFTINSRPTVDPDYIELFGEKVAGQNAYLKGLALIEHWGNTLTSDQTLIVDSLSFWNDYTVEHVLQLENQRKPRIQDWGAAQKLLELTVEALNNIDCNLIVIAHEQFVKDDESGFISWLPLTIGKLATKIPIYFDEVWRCYSEPGRGADRDTQIYGIETKPTRRTTAKSRLHLPFQFTDATYASIMAAWKLTQTQHN